MRVTPAEIGDADLPRAWLRGYRRSSVEELLEDIADTVDRVSRERAQLSERLAELQTEASKHRELEALLRSTLISAERAAQELKEQARRESDLLVQEAHAESRRITRECAAEKRRLEEDVSRIRAQLVAAFEMLGEWPGDASKTSEEAGSMTEPTAIEEVLDSGIHSVPRHAAPAEAS
jgi:cell division initiation protein